MNPSLETDVRGPVGEYAIDWKSLLWPCNKLIHWPVAISQLLISLRKLDAICVLSDDQAMMVAPPPPPASIVLNVDKHWLVDTCHIIVKLKSSPETMHL